MNFENQLILAISPIIGLSVNVFIQVILFRYRLVKSLLSSIFIGFVLGLMSVICAILMGSPREIIPVIILNFFTYGSLGYGYFHFINLGETARRIRILREFREKTLMTAEELASRYNAKEMVDKRVARLLASRQIIQTDSEFILGRSSVLFMVRIINLLKLITLSNKDRDRLLELRIIASTQSNS